MHLAPSLLVLILQGKSVLLAMIIIDVFLVVSTRGGPRVQTALVVLKLGIYYEQMSNGNCLSVASVVAYV